MGKVEVNMKTIDTSFWKDKRVFLTGHTGFKGSWLSLWLQSIGADVHGFALSPPTQPALFSEANVGVDMTSSFGDIGDFKHLMDVMGKYQPDIIFHGAAQPLVRFSYKYPIETYVTNVLGTVHVLEAARQVGTAKAIVNITTDKCYEIQDKKLGYCEEDTLGGHDPYSSSKACSELISSTYRESYFENSGISLATARAGNVIGGGDWAVDRLVPDILRSFEKGQSVLVRNPHAIRPWQHVLEPLSGYIMLAEKLFSDKNFAEGWNFGPNDEDARSVQWIVEYMVASWKQGVGWKSDEGVHPHEANVLKLNITKSRNRLGWSPRWSLPTALDKIIDWHDAWLKKANIRETCLEQINDYMSSSNR